MGLHFSDGTDDDRQNQAAYPPGSFGKGRLGLRGVNKEERLGPLPQDLPVDLASKDINVAIPLASLLQLYALVGDTRRDGDIKTGIKYGNLTGRPLTNGNGAGYHN